MTARFLREKVPSMPKKQAFALKDAMAATFPKTKSCAYRDKLNQIAFNIRHNPALLQQKTAPEIVAMTDADYRALMPVVTSERKTSREVLKDMLSIETLDEEKLAAHAPMAICRKCGGTEISFDSVQTRSGDEQQTLFLFCQNRLCLFKWIVR